MVLKTTSRRNWIIADLGRRPELHHWEFHIRQCNWDKSAASFHLSKVHRYDVPIFYTMVYAAAKVPVNKAVSIATCAALRHNRVTQAEQKR